MADMTRFGEDRRHALGYTHRPLLSSCHAGPHRGKGLDVQPGALEVLIQTACGISTSKYPAEAEDLRDPVGPYTLVWEFTFLLLILT